MALLMAATERYQGDADYQLDLDRLTPPKQEIQPVPCWRKPTCSIWGRYAPRAAVQGWTRAPVRRTHRRWRGTSASRAFRSTTLTRRWTPLPSWRSRDVAHLDLRLRREAPAMPRLPCFIQGGCSAPDCGRPLCEDHVRYVDKAPRCATHAPMTSNPDAAPSAPPPCGADMTASITRPRKGLQSALGSPSAPTRTRRLASTRTSAPRPANSPRATGPAR